MGRMMWECKLTANIDNPSQELVTHQMVGSDQVDRTCNVKQKRSVRGQAGDLTHSILPIHDFFNFS